MYNFSKYRIKKLYLLATASPGVVILKKVGFYGSPY